MSKDMGVTRLEIEQLLSFGKANFDFCDGINILIGENSTGKTQALKLIYSMLRASELYRQKQPAEQGAKPPAHLTNKLNAVFRPDDEQTGRLVRRGVGRRKGSAIIRWKPTDRMELTVSNLGRVTRTLPRGSPPKTIFLPSREVLAMYPGFIAAYEARELAFDETYFDLAKAMSATPLRGPRGERASELIRPLLEVLHCRIVLQGGRFHLASKEGNLEAHLLSEGIRKLGTLAHLVSNGALAKHTVLLWDEPEASLNPKAVTVVARLLLALAKQGIQIFIATHDFLLSQELSLAAEYKTEPAVPIRFFALERHKNSGVGVEAAKTIGELQTNPIVQEFAAHYDREQRLFAHSPKASAKGANGGNEDY
jgi:ABC-type transport system involved in cytochrome c biogenesis ATPase subunit